MQSPSAQFATKTKGAPFYCAYSLRILARAEQPVYREEKKAQNKDGSGDVGEK